MGAKFTKAQADAQRNYREKIKFIQLTLSQEEKDKISNAATASGQSVNGFIKQAILEKIEREGAESE